MGRHWAGWGGGVGEEALGRRRGGCDEALGGVASWCRLQQVKLPREQRYRLDIRMRYRLQQADFVAAHSLPRHAHVQVARGHVAASPWAERMEVRECDGVAELQNMARAGEGPFEVSRGERQDEGRETR